MGQGHDSSQWPVATVVTNRDFTGMAHSAELAELPLRVEVLHKYFDQITCNIDQLDLILNDLFLLQQKMRLNKYIHE